MARIALLVVTLLLVAGCSFGPHGFDHGSLARATRVDRLRVTDAEITAAKALQPQLALPFKVAVWFRPAGWWRQHRFEWRDEDREAVLGALRPLAASGILTDVFPIADSIVTGDDVRAARLAAARLGADSVLIVTGASAVDRYSTPAALLYATVVGLWVVPGSHTDGIFLATGSLWDVRDGSLYAAAEAQGTSGLTGPAMLLEDGEVTTVAQRMAVNALAHELRVRVASLAESAVTAANAP